jgi:hypothetical protein
MKRADKVTKWGVYLMKKKRQWVESVEAAHEAEALEKAGALPEIAEQDITVQ